LPEAAPQRREGGRRLLDLILRRIFLFYAMAEKHYRSLLKAVSWRITGSIDTLIITFIVTGKLKWAFTVSGIELFTKVFLYYVHERVWHKIPLGKYEDRPGYEI